PDAPAVRKPAGAVVFGAESPARSAPVARPLRIGGRRDSLLLRWFEPLQKKDVAVLGSCPELEPVVTRRGAREVAACRGLVSRKSGRRVEECDLTVLDVGDRTGSGDEVRLRHPFRSFVTPRLPAGCHVDPDELTRFLGSGRAEDQQPAAVLCEGREG